MAITLEEVHKIADLARLAVSDEEAQTYTKELSSILNFVEEMKVVETHGIEPMAHSCTSLQRLRLDEVSEEVVRDALQQGAPSIAYGLYLVPQVIAESE